MKPVIFRFLKLGGLGALALVALLTAFGPAPADARLFVRVGIGGPYAILAGALPPQRMGVYMGIFNFFIVLPEILTALRLDRQLSPTRLNGLASVRVMIRAFAKSHLQP